MIDDIDATPLTAEQKEALTRALRSKTHPRITALESELEEKDKRIAELEARLEMGWVYDAEGNKAKAPSGTPDGISCRDETIRLQDEQIERLQADNAELEAENTAHFLAAAVYDAELQEEKAANAELRDMHKIMEFIFEHDLHGEIWWRTDGEYAPIRFFANCNDVFAWACADVEPVTVDDLEDIAKAEEDCRAVGHEVYGLTLWCCRKRQSKPQKAMYSETDEKLWPLFDAAALRQRAGQESEDE